MECDTAKVGELLPVYWFQSTHPHGVRLHPKRCIYTYRRVSIHAPAWGATFITHPDSLFKSFNPRTRMGCDYDYLAQMRFETVSIHAPAWGATCFVGFCLLNASVSIHAPAWGATDNLQSCISECWFQSTHPHGVRLNVRQTYNVPFMFQSTHPHGVRHKYHFH